MADDVNTSGNTDVVSEYYESYTETQKEILAISLRKTKNTLFIMAVIVFASDFLSLLMLNAVSFQTVIYVATIPLVLLGLGFLALKEPLAAMIIAAVIIVGIWIYAIVVTGGRAAIMGWLIKAVIVFFIISGFRHAGEATKIKKELKG